MASIVWGWGAGQYPYLLEDTLTVQEGAAGDATLKNGWLTTTKTGEYGTNYVQRALITAKIGRAHV